MVSFPVSKWAAHSKQGKSAKIIFADRDDDEQGMVFMATLLILIHWDRVRVPGEKQPVHEMLKTVRTNRWS